MPEVSDTTITINQYSFKLHLPVLKYLALPFSNNRYRIRCPQILQRSDYSEIKVSQTGAMNFFKYIYSGELPGWDMSIQDVLELWIFATIVKVPPLLHQCKIIVRNCSPSSHPIR